MKKITKLEMLLNKVVEYNKPNDTYIKAFLYKDAKGYYLKVVEILLGTLMFNQIIYLVDGDENFIIKAEKPKLMRVSFKSWHYRLVKFVLKDSAPTPKTMQNGCPYFWLLLFSIFSVPFILLYKAIKWVVMLIPHALNWYLEKTAIKWLAELDDVTVYDYYKTRNKIPKGVKMYFKRKDTYDSPYSIVLDQYIKNKYSDMTYWDARSTLNEKWKMWFTETYDEKIKKREILEKKREERAEKWDKKMKPFNKLMDKFVNFVYKIIDDIKKVFTFERGKLNIIIKRTKQFVGFIITLLILASSFVVINLLVRLIIYLTALCVANWVAIAVVGIIIAAIGVVYLIYLAISTWLQNVVNKYKSGRKIWYIEILLYLTFYPLKYITIGLKYIVWYPVKFIFYELLFKLVLTPIGKILFKIFMTIWSGFVGSTGIFGEYFGASYSDYCPGLEWCDFEDEDEDINS